MTVATATVTAIAHDLEQQLKKVNHLRAEVNCAAQAKTSAAAAPGDHEGADQAEEESAIARNKDTIVDRATKPMPKPGPDVKRAPAEEKKTQRAKPAAAATTASTATVAAVAPPLPGTSSGSGAASLLGFILLTFIVLCVVTVSAAVVLFDIAAPPVGLSHAPLPVLQHHAKGMRVKIFSDVLAASARGKAAAGSTSVFVRAQGPRTGETVLLVHGSTGTSFAFRVLLDTLAARGLSAVAFDLPGHGLSAARGDPMPLPAATDTVTAAYIAAVARALQLPPHHLVVMEDAAGAGVEYAALYGRGKNGGGGGGAVMRSLSFLEPQLRAPTSPCFPAHLLTLPLGLGAALAATPLLPLAITRGCARGMSPDDAASHAFLLRVDGALSTGLSARRSALGARSPSAARGGDGGRAAALLLLAAAAMPSDVPKQMMWAGDSPTPAASQQAAIVQVRVSFIASLVRHYPFILISVNPDPTPQTVKP